MVESHAHEEILTVPAEATAFLAAVSALAVFLLVIFIFVNKKWRLLNVDFTPTPTQSKPPTGHHEFRILNQSTAHSSSFQGGNDEVHVHTKRGDKIGGPSGHEGISARSYALHQLHNQRTLDYSPSLMGGESGSPSMGQLSVHHPPSLYGGKVSQAARPLRVTTIRDVDDLSTSRRRAHQRGHLTRSVTAPNSRKVETSDLMSLAEKGNACGGSSASSTSSNVSGEDEVQGVQRNPPSQALSGPRHLQHPPPSASTNFRRMMMPPRTKSVDSESPPPSSIADQDQDHIFEVEEMSLVEGDLGMIGDSGRRTAAAVQCGSVEVAFDYDAIDRKMTVHIVQARGVPDKEIGGANNTQVRIVLLPSRRQKHKTKTRPGENPQFMESFVFSKINPEDVSGLGIRFRLYGCERMRRERLLGETVLAFGTLHLEMETTLWINLEPRYHLTWDSRSDCSSLARSESASSTQSIQSGIPELLVGLAYNGTTGRLTVEVIKGSHFRNLAGGRAPDSYIKLSLLSCNGQEMGRAKSSLRRAQSNPLFKETFMFQIALFQIPEVTLLVSVYGRKGVTRRELLGWFALGYNGSGDEETTHWEDMADARGDQMCRWHVLLQT